MANKKAPGVDLVEVEVLKAAVKAIPDKFAKLYNGCLQWGVFPSQWKVGNLRILLKGEDKDVEDPKSYRPICLLSVIGKLFEKLIMKRLNQTSLSPGYISDRQFGFTPGKSTEDAIVELRRMVSASERRYVVALLFDISGAFDNVWWPLVLDSLKKKDCPPNLYKVLKNYFSNRTVEISFGDVKAFKQASRGCPQGSVLGPACWNIMFNTLLERLMAKIGNTFVAYADDLAVIVEGDSRRELERKGQEVVDEIEEWCKLAKLKISEKKTEAIVLKNDLIRRDPIGRRGGERPDRRRKAVRSKKADLTKRLPIIKINRTKIEFKKTVRYLGVYLDSEMKVSTHCKNLSNKVGTLFAKLGRQARCQWGLRFTCLSTIYRGVFAPTVAYAAAGWTDLCVGRDLEVLKTLQRRVLISTTSAYRTVSTEALCVAAGAVPIDIVFAELVARYQIRKGENAEIGNTLIRYNGDQKEALGQIRMEALRLWQARWSSSEKGRITSTFFNSVQERIGATWVRPDHYSTQMMTGHGEFSSRLAALNLRDERMCRCGESEDTVSHHILECRDFAPQREVLQDVVPSENWKWPDVASFLMSTPEAFQVFADFCRVTLWIKSQEST